MRESLADFKARIAGMMKGAPIETVTNMELHRWRRAIVRKSHYPPSKNNQKGKRVSGRTTNDNN